ncbi:MAG: VanZ family protein [Bacteroidales bacterium]|nr:VanZ family protein [Bacteroidales bacterium]
MKTIKLIIWIIFILLITTVSLLSDPPSFLEDSFSKPWIIRHILAFVVFILLTRITFPKLKWYWLVLIGFGFGLSIELLQLWLTGGVREFSLLDLGYDAVGIVVGMGIVSLKSKV